MPRTGLSPAVARRSRRFRYRFPLSLPPTEGGPALQPRPDGSGRFGLVRVRSPLLTESLLLSPPGGTEMFQFPPFATRGYGLTARHSGTPGSTPG